MLTKDAPVVYNQLEFNSENSEKMKAQKLSGLGNQVRVLSSPAAVLTELFRYANAATEGYALGRFWKSGDV